MKEFDEKINKEDDEINEDKVGGYEEESIEPDKTCQKIILADATELNIKIQELLNVLSNFKVNRDPEVRRKAYLR